MLQGVQGPQRLLYQGIERDSGGLHPNAGRRILYRGQTSGENAEDFCKWCLTDFCYKENDEGNATDDGKIHFSDPLPGPDVPEPEFVGETVMMAPASGFYATPGLGLDEVRMAYVLNTKDLRRAIIVLRAALEEYKKSGRD